MTDAMTYEKAHLIKMANQIAANIPTRRYIPEQIAGHFRNFWTPAMRAQIEELAREHPEDLVPDVHEALRYLRSVEV
jgi:hypothetical protein